MRGEVRLGQHVDRQLDDPGHSIERAELDGHYDAGHFPGLRLTRSPPVAELAIPPPGAVDRNTGRSSREGCKLPPQQGPIAPAGQR